LRLGIAFFRQPLDLAHVVHAADPLESAFLVQDRFDLLERPARLSRQVEVHRRVEVSAARAHDQSFQGRQAHGGVDAPAALNRRGTGAVAEMERDEVEMLERDTQIARGFLGHVMMGGPVKAVAADVVLPMEFAGQRIVERPRRHALMKGGIENRHIGHIGAEGAERFDGGHIGRVVKGRKRDQLLDPSYRLIIDDHRLTKHLSAVDDPVAEPEKRAGVDPGGGVAHRGFEDEPETLAVVGNRVRLADFLPVA